MANNDDSSNNEIKPKNTDVLSKILYEAKSYKRIEDIEKLVEINSDLSMVPLQPLYVSLLNSSTDQVAMVLPKLSGEQRQTLLDLDLWNKDVVDVYSFEFWIETYSKVQDLELTKEFVSSDDFLLYLKSRVNIYTFDTEDPMYPDHDYYFLTDDTLLLVEYSEEYKYPNELKYLVRNLYDRYGVEKAYALLFKLVNDSFSMLQEKEYQVKKERLRDYGFVDYFEAIEKLHSFISYKQIDNYILSKKVITPNIDQLSRNQSIHSSALVSFDSDMENILKELSKVKDEARLNYLHFTFVRLINSTITINDALKGGRVELTRIGKITKNCMELGLQKIKSLRANSEEESVFESFDFFDLYKVGNSLITLERNRIKKALKKSPFEEDDYEYFLGAWWASFLEAAELDIPKVKAYGAGLHAKTVDNLPTYESWKGFVSLFKNSVPFINSFFDMFVSLRNEGKLHDSFYLNYEVENIDFEAILISSFINFSLGNFSGNDVNKMGVSISELKEFFKTYFFKKDEEYILFSLDDEKFVKVIHSFVEKFGFDQIDGFESYLYGVLSEHLNGYEFDTLSDEDYQHIGGPILLNTLVKN